MEISLDQLGAWMEAFFWPFLRIGALFLAAPIFGARTVPVRVRIVLAVLITILVTPSAGPTPDFAVVSPVGVLIILQQLAIGLVMGFILQLMFGALVMAGQSVATAMGLGFASAVDPQNGVQVTVVGQFYLIIATLLFLAVDGHLALIDIFAQSFQLLPVAPAVLSVEVFWQAVLFGGQMFAAATLIALPTMAGVLLVNIAFGVMTRAAPQLNIFAMGFSMIMLAGFVLMLLSLPVLVPQLLELFTTSLDLVRALANPV